MDSDCSQPLNRGSLGVPLGSRIASPQKGQPWLQVHRTPSGSHNRTSAAQQNQGRITEPGPHNRTRAAQQNRNLSALLKTARDQGHRMTCREDQSRVPKRRTTFGDQSSRDSHPDSLPGPLGAHHAFLRPMD